MSEHIARDMREGRFPERSEPQMMPTPATPDAQLSGNSGELDAQGDERVVRKIEPGSDMHMHVLMSPWHLQMLTGDDLKHVTDFGKAVWAYALSRQPSAPASAVEALRKILALPRGTSGRIIIERSEEEEARAALAAAKQETANYSNSSKDSDAEHASAGELREPKNGAGWKVVWWNESMRLMLPESRFLDHSNHYRNGTAILTIKDVGAARAQRADKEAS